MEIISVFLRCFVLAGVVATLNGCAQLTPGTKAQINQEKQNLEREQEQEPEQALAPANNRPSQSQQRSYTVRGKTYTTLPTAEGYAEEGAASWYGSKFHGKQTASGEVYNMHKLTAAHKTLPFTSYVKVTNQENNRSVIVRVNDRGPFHEDRLIDVSYAAAKELGMTNQGVVHVIVEDIGSHAVITSPQPRNQQPEVSIRSREEEPEAIAPGMYLQLAALKSYQGAQNMKHELLYRLGINAEIKSSNDSDNSFHRVWVGPVEDDKQMKSLLERLADAQFEQPYVVYE